MENSAAYSQSADEVFFLMDGVAFSSNRSILIDKTRIFINSRYSVITAFEVRRLVIYRADQIFSGSKQLCNECLASLSI